MGANIVEAAGDRVAEPFKPYVMLQRNGLTIGILGLTTIETKEKASQFNLQKVKILPPEQIAQVYVDELRRQGAQIIVLLAHIGSSQGENNGITGEIVPVLQKIHGVDAVVTGHSHLCVSGTYGGIPVIQAGCHGEAVGRINLLYSMADQKVVSANSRIYKLSELPRAQDTAMEMFVPYLKRVTDAVHKLGMYFELHSCGKNETLVPAYIAAGVDLWCPQVINDVKMLAEKYKDAPITFGMQGIDVSADAAEEEQRQAAVSWFETYKDYRVVPAFMNSTPTIAATLYKLSREYYNRKNQMSEF